MFLKTLRFALIPSRWFATAAHTDLTKKANTPLSGHVVSTIDTICPTVGLLKVRREIANESQCQLLTSRLLTGATTMDPKTNRRIGSGDSSQPIFRTHRTDDHDDSDKSVRNPAPDSSPPAAPNGKYWEGKISHSD